MSTRINIGYKMMKSVFFLGSIGLLLVHQPASAYTGPESARFSLAGAWVASQRSKNTSISDQPLVAPSADELSPAVEEGVDVTKKLSYARRMQLLPHLESAQKKMNQPLSPVEFSERLEDRIKSSPYDLIRKFLYMPSLQESEVSYSLKMPRNSVPDQRLEVRSLGVYIIPHKNSFTAIESGILKKYDYNYEEADKQAAQQAALLYLPGVQSLEQKRNVRFLMRASNQTGATALQ